MSAEVVQQDARDQKCINLGVLGHAPQENFCKHDDEEGYNALGSSYLKVTLHATDFQKCGRLGTMMELLIILIEVSVRVILTG